MNINDKFEIERLKLALEHERAEKYAAQAEQVALRGRIEELREKLFDNVMAAKKSGYEDGVTWMQAKLAAVEVALDEIREWCVIAERENGLIGPVRTRLCIDAARGEKP
jgi:hypothetical protein